MIDVSWYLCGANTSRAEHPYCSPFYPACRKMNDGEIAGYSRKRQYHAIDVPSKKKCTVCCNKDGTFKEDHGPWTTQSRCTRTERAACIVAAALPTSASAPKWPLMRC